MIDLEETLVLFAKTEYQKELKNLNANELHNVVSRAVMAEISDRWSASRQKHRQHRCAYYFSAEFLRSATVLSKSYYLMLFLNFFNFFTKSFASSLYGIASLSSSSDQIL